MNYAALAALIEDTTQNNDPVFLANIPVFVQLAERQIYMEGDLPATRLNTTLPATVGSRSLTLPIGLITLKSVDLTTTAGVVNLLPKAAEFLTEMYPLTATQAVPKYYARYDETTIQLAPTPDLTYSVGLHYFGVPTSIVTAGTTWLGDNFEQVLLYAALVHAYIFMKGSEDIMKYYTGSYTIALAEMRKVMAPTDMQGFRS